MARAIVCFSKSRFSGSGIRSTGSFQHHKEDCIPNLSQLLSHINFVVVNTFIIFEGISHFCLRMKVKAKFVSKYVSGSLKSEEG